MRRVRLFTTDYGAHFSVDEEVDGAAMIFPRDVGVDSRPQDAASVPGSWSWSRPRAPPSARRRQLLIGGAPSHMRRRSGAARHHYCAVLHAHYSPAADGTAHRVVPTRYLMAAPRWRSVTAGNYEGWRISSSFRTATAHGARLRPSGRARGGQLTGMAVPLADRPGGRFLIRLIFGGRLGSVRPNRFPPAIAYPPGVETSWRPLRVLDLGPAGGPWRRASTAGFAVLH